MNIPSKSQLIEDLKKTFIETKTWINQQPKDHFNKELIPEKWTIAEHLYHLIKSTKAVSNGMKMPKKVLIEMFGERNTPERTFDELKVKYETTLDEVVVVVPGNYTAEKGRQFDQSEYLKRFDTELDDLVQEIEKWSEEDLGKYLMPHPVLGNFTIREFIYFTTFHTDHHLRTFKEKYEIA